MNSSDFFHALGGGTLIGLSAIFLLFFNGRIAGISGMLRGLLPPSRKALPHLVFLLGLVAGAGAYGYGTGTLPSARPEFPPLLLGVAGVLVGTGTALARGCTSGHGVCGLARFSRRSFISVGLFLSSAMVTTYLVRHIWGIQ